MTTGDNMLLHSGTVFDWRWCRGAIPLAFTSPTAHQGHAWPHMPSVGEFNHIWIICAFHCCLSEIARAKAPPLVTDFKIMSMLRSHLHRSHSSLSRISPAAFQFFPHKIHLIELIFKIYFSCLNIRDSTPIIAAFSHWYIAQISHKIVNTCAGLHLCSRGRSQVKPVGFLE